MGKTATDNLEALGVDNRGIWLPTDQIQNWKVNDEIRQSNTEDFNRLLQQMRMGQYKPLLITDLDGQWVSLGGNNRLRAHKKLKHPKVWCSIVEFKEEAGGWTAYVNGELCKYPDDYPEKDLAGAALRFESKEDGMLEFNLSDNDSIARYHDLKLAEVVANSHIDVNTYKIELGAATKLTDLLGNFGAGDREVDTSNLEHDMETYLQGGVKQIVVYFTNDQYMDVMARIEKIQQDNTELKTNTDVFMAMLENYENTQD